MSYEPVLHNERASGDHPDRNEHDVDLADQDKRPWPKSRHGLTPKQLRRLISIAAGTVMTLFGYEQGVFGGIIIGQRFLEYFDNPSVSTTGFVTSVYDLGCLFGAILALLVGQILGRRRMLVVFTSIMTTGIIIQTVAPSMQVLVWGRIIAGVGNGGNTATAPVWHVEASKAEAKGKAVAMEMTVNVLGFVISNVLTLAFSHSSTNAQWRFPLGIQLIFCVIILILVPILPESPRWLLSKGREREAKIVLAQLNEHDIEEDFREIRVSVREEVSAQVSWLHMFQGGTPTRRALLGVLLQVCQQLSGINVLCYYLPFVLHESVGLPEDPSRILATAIAVLYMFAAAFAISLVERLGRRRLLIWSAAAMSVAFAGIAVSTEIEQSGEGHLVPGIVATVFMITYFCAFGCGWVAIPWMYPAEINSLSLRTKGAALATGFNWGMNWLVAYTTPAGLVSLKWGLYAVYAIFNAAFVPIVYYLVVETAGKSLEQIDDWFARHPGWRVDKIADNVPGQFGTALGSKGREEESRGLFSETVVHGLDESRYDGDAAALEDRDFVIAGELESEDEDDAR